MRSINLLKVAAEAELLRLRILLARQGRRAAFGVVAVIFMLGVLVLAEMAGWQVLRLYVASISATLILLGINFVIATIFGALAARSSPSHVEREALRIRRQALDAARGTLFFTAAVPVGRAPANLGPELEGCHVAETNRRPTSAERHHAFFDRADARQGPGGQHRRRQADA